VGNGKVEYGADRAQNVPWSRLNTSSKGPTHGGAGPPKAKYPTTSDRRLPALARPIPPCARREQAPAARAKPEVRKALRLTLPIGVSDRAICSRNTAPPSLPWKSPKRTKHNIAFAVACKSQLTTLGMSRGRVRYTRGAAAP